MSAAPQLPNRIREWRKRRNLTQQQLAERVEPCTTAKQISRLEKEERELTRDWMNRLAAPLQVKPYELLHEYAGQSPSVRIAGAVEAGEEIFFNEHDTLLHNYAPPLVANSGLQAVVVRSNSLLPRYEEGEILYYEPSTSVSEQCFGRYCIVALEGGRSFVKRVFPSPSPGHYRLRSVNGADVEVGNVLWAAPVAFVGCIPFTDAER